MGLSAVNGASSGVGFSNASLLLGKQDGNKPVGSVSLLGNQDDEEMKKLKGGSQTVAYSAPILSFPPSTDASAVRGRGESFNAIG